MILFHVCTRLPPHVLMPEHCMAVEVYYIFVYTTSFLGVLDAVGDEIFGLHIFLTSHKISSKLSITQNCHHCTCPGSTSLAGRLLCGSVCIRVPTTST